MRAARTACPDPAINEAAFSKYLWQVGCLGRAYDPDSAQLRACEGRMWRALCELSPTLGGTCDHHPPGKQGQTGRSHFVPIKEDAPAPDTSPVTVLLDS